MKSVHNACMRIEQYLDREMGVEETHRFEAHLQECDVCREAAAQWETITHAYAVWTTQQDDARPEQPNHAEALSFVHRIQKKLSLPHSPAPPRKLTSKPLTWIGIAAAVVLTVAGAGIYRYRQTMHLPDSGASNATITPSSKPVSVDSPASRQARIVHFSNGVKTTNSTVIAEGQLLTADSEERVLVHIDNDDIGIGAGSSLGVQHSTDQRKSFILHGGIAAFQVAPRKKGELFEISVRNVAVTVVGTRFSVQLKPYGDIVVAVTEGIVRITRNDEQFVLSAGNRLTVSKHGSIENSIATGDDTLGIQQLLNTAVSGVTAQVSEPALPIEASQRSTQKNAASGHIDRNIETWQRLIIEGNTQVATTQILSYLRTTPNDAEAMMLLATCQKRLGKHEAAFHTYKDIIRTGTPSLANRARYSAGEIAQDRLNMAEESAALFSAYLQHTAAGSPNRGEAKLRLSKSLFQTGDSTRAHTLLQEIIKEYGRAPVANRARVLLESNP
ncbi:MAG: FecR domain-containing protein [Deltaproteobacteria bacterium]|nr:FecR domain-containing protein [Deltaproteobacteria bacterium]MBN2672679.1 FecR domain-containing protein [Deltaproteobacteria bacterium]